jgi:hypothetical protein
MKGEKKYEKYGWIKGQTYQLHPIEKCWRSFFLIERC